MCGIYGILSLDGSSPGERRLLSDMGAAILHRGPDDEGGFADGPLLFGMRRLSIIDLEGGHQPIANEEGTVVVVCNGEIYNFQSLRADLQQRGHRFKTNSDTEVIVHLYEEYGTECVSHLRGMFGFALWDARRHRLLIARDRLGIKPLYIWQDGKRLAFASEAKALLVVPGIDAALDRDALSEYLTLGYVSAPRSLFRGIRKLQPGHLLVSENGSCQQHRWWTQPKRIDAVRKSSDWIAGIRETLESSVAAQMVSDVPLGAFLSGGVDSSAVVAMMSRHTSEPVRTYAIGFKGTSGAEFYNELPYARQVADIFGTRHREIVVQPDVVDLLPRLIWHLDEPVADAAMITTWLVSQFAHEDVKVILSGVGGDELFGGYRRYLGAHYQRYVQWLPEPLRRRVLLPLARRLPADRHSKLLNLARYARAFLLSSGQSPQQRYRSYIEVFSRQAAALLLQAELIDHDGVDAAFAEINDSDPVDSLMRVDLQTQMPDDLLMLTDKMSMATSLECRVPLLDEALLDLSLSMPASLKVKGSTLKYGLKAALSGILPNDIIHRSKRGFGAPMGAWFKNELAPLVAQLLSPETVAARGLLDPGIVQETVIEHRENRADHSDHLLALINLELWCRIYLDRSTPEDLAAEIRCHA